MIPPQSSSSNCFLSSFSFSAESPGGGRAGGDVPTCFLALKFTEAYGRRPSGTSL